MNIYLSRFLKINKMQSYILLENIEIYAHHGVMTQETLVGNTFILNLKIKANVSKATETDNLAETINYAKVYELLEEEMAVSSKLLEHVAGRIIKRLKKEFPQIEEIEIKLSKRNPPINGKVEYASVILIG